MGFKSYIFRHSGAGRRLEKRKEELKDKLRAARAENAELKEALRLATASIGQPPARHQVIEAAMSVALQQLRIEASRSVIPSLPEILNRVQCAASEHDIMLKKSQPEHYLRVGLSALESMHRMVPDLVTSPPGRILDFGCGFGRVARFMQAAWPTANLNVCDVDFAGLAFCIAHLGMKGFPVGIDPTKMSLGQGYDLIWVGSVITHLNETLIRQLIAALADSLAPGGKLFFTTHGDHPAAMMKAGRSYDLDSGKPAEMAESYERAGFGYADYPETLGYGVSLTSEPWIRQVVAGVEHLRCVGFEAKGWASHQDMFACMRV